MLQCQQLRQPGLRAQHCRGGSTPALNMLSTMCETFSWTCKKKTSLPPVNWRWVEEGDGYVGRIQRTVPAWVLPVSQLSASLPGPDQKRMLRGHAVGEPLECYSVGHHEHSGFCRFVAPCVWGNMYTMLVR